MSKRLSHRPVTTSRHHPLPICKAIPTHYRLPKPCHHRSHPSADDRSVDRIIPDIRAPTSSLRTPEKHGRSLSAILVTLFAVFIFSIIAYCLTHPGYRVTRSGDSDYILSTTISREEAAHFTENMTANHTTRYPIRDLRLPDGTFATIYLSLEKAQSIAVSSDPRHTISTTWRYSDHYYQTVNSSGTLIRIPVKYTYQEIVNAIEQCESGDLDRVLMSIEPANISGNQVFFCYLSKPDLIAYRLRMRVAGASSIIISFYQNIDRASASSTPPSEPF